MTFEPNVSAMSQPDYLFSPADPASLPIEGSSERFPIRRVYCVGRNFAEHAREMGSDPEAEPPFFFQKNPEDADLSGLFPYPADAPAGAVHHEVELAVALLLGGRHMSREDARDAVFGYAVALDMTRRDLQSVAKASGRPWAMAKAFDRSLPIGPITPADRVDTMENGAIILSVNGDIRQSGDLNQMIWPVDAIIAALSAHVTLAPGDLILTGTPAGVGPVAPGDVMEARIDGLPPLCVKVIETPDQN